LILEGFLKFGNLGIGSGIETEIEGSDFVGNANSTGSEKKTDFGSKIKVLD
jgi:hypothetical protein